MIQTRFVLCATRIIRDADENRMTAVDIFEEIGSPVFPIVLPRVSFLWVLVRDEGDPQVHDGTIVIRQGEQELGRFQVKIDFQQALSTRLIAVAGGLVVRQAGRITITFEIPEVVTSTYHIDVRAVPQLITQHPEAGKPVPPDGPQGGAIII